MFSGGTFTESHKVRTSRCVTGVFCTTENLENLKHFLGIFVDYRNENKIASVHHDSIGWKIGLRNHCTIVSVALVTNKGDFIGPDHEWNFSNIKTTALQSPDVCALLLFTEQY
jgi:hypothetical protein